MRKVKIAVDSTLDLSKELIEEFDIDVWPLTLSFGPNEVYYDGIDITTEELYQKVEEKKVLPKTSAATPGELYKIFKQYLDDGYDLIYTGIGSKLSSSYNNAMMAREELEAEDRIEVIDSGNLSTGIGLLVLKACKYRDEGLNVHEIADEVRKFVPLVKSQFLVKTLDYLHKGGRCSGVAKLLGNILKIKPLIVVRDGSMSVGAKPRGKMINCISSLIDMLKEDLGNIDEDFVFVTHSIADEEAAILVPQVKTLCPGMRVEETRAGGIISTHCGPGTIGILWINKEKTAC